MSVVKFVVLSSILSVVSASLAIGYPNPKPEKFKDVQGCYIEALDSVIPDGGEAPAGELCAQYRCSGTAYSLTTCGVIVVPETCATTSDASKPYPYCCPKPSCPEKI